MQHATFGAILLTILIIGPIVANFFIKSTDFYIRKVKGIDAIFNVIGKSVEKGKTISFSTSMTSVGPLLYACLGILSSIGKKVATYKAKIIIPSRDPEVMAMTDATLQNAYLKEKKSSLYDPNSIRFLSSEQFAYASGYMGLMHRENVGAAFLFGSFAAESLILAEAGQQVGANQIAGSISPEQVPFFITSCDYTLIGEEIYAAGAYLSDDPIQKRSLRGQDFSKLTILLIILIGIALNTTSSICKLSSKPSCSKLDAKQIFLKLQDLNMFKKI